MNPHLKTVDRWLSQRLPNTSFDEDGIASLGINERTAVFLEIPVESEVCHFYAPVSMLDTEAPDKDLYGALTLNRFGRPLGGCWLAWDPELGMITLCYNLHIPSSDAVSFCNAIDNFAVALSEARSALGHMAPT